MTAEKMGASVGASENVSFTDNKITLEYREPVVPEPEPEPDPEIAALRGEIEDMRKALQVAAVNEALAKSGLSKAGQEVVRRAMEGRDASQLQGFIDAQRQVESEYAERSTIQGIRPGTGVRITNMRNSIDQLGEAVDALVAGTRPPSNIRPLQGLRELYMLTSGDYDLTGHFHPENIELAAVTTATMPYLVANAMNKVVTHVFNDYPAFWRKLVHEMDVNNLQDIKWLQLGGMTDLPDVAEGAAYQEASWTDATESGTWKKKGYYMGLTMESIDKDDTSKLQQAPRVMAITAHRTLAKDFTRLFTQSSGTGPTLSDATAWFTSGHGNLGSTAFSKASVQATILAMQKQTELGSGERMGDITRPRYFMLPIDLEFTALEILASMFDGAEGTTTARMIDNVLTDVNTHSERMAAARDRIVLNPFLTDTNDWVAMADPRVWPTVVIAYRFGRQPQVFSTQDENSGLMFTNDTLPIKVRWFYSTSVVNYRGVYKHNVT